MDRIFAYTDYRQFLRDYFDAKKSGNPHFSYRVLAQKAGFKARDYLLRVMNGSRGLSKSSVFMVAQALDLNPKESEYFVNLVGLNDARTPDEKEYFFKKLSDVRKHGRHQKLREDQYEYYSTWYHGAIRSLVTVIDFKDDFAKLAAFLDPPITAREARASVELLIRLGLLERRHGGKYAVTNTTVTTGDEVHSLALAAFHKNVMDLAKRSINAHSSSIRDISGITMSLSPKGFERVKSEVQEFRKKILAIAGEDTDEERAYRINFHLFPLSRARSGQR